MIRPPGWATMAAFVVLTGSTGPIAVADASHRLPRPGADASAVSAAASPSATSPGFSPSSSSPASSLSPSLSPSEANGTGGQNSGTSGMSGMSDDNETSLPALNADELKAKIDAIRKEAAASRSGYGNGNNGGSGSNSGGNSNDYSGDAAASSGSKAAHKSRMLQGSIDQYGEAKQQAFNIGLGIIAKKEADPKLGSRVIQLLPSSAAQQGGVRAGDHILSETLNKDVVNLSISRAGKMLQISLKTGGPAMFELTGGADQNALQAGVGQTTLHSGTGHNTLQAGVSRGSLQAGTTAMKLKANVVEQMRDHDVVLILDMSGSMTTRDCQGLSRWDWVAGQSNELAIATQQASSDLSLLLFSSRYQEMDHISPSLIPIIFQRVRPGGGTILGAPLDEVLTHYFAERDRNPKVKPLIVTIITDGLPGDYMQVRQIITNAANAT